MFYHQQITFLSIILLFSLLCAGSFQNITGSVSSDLFNSLEELSRLVDISYCVGTTGVQEPFQCLSHCTWNTGVLLSDSCGYIAVSHPPAEKRIVVTFRGTYSFTNTIIDLSAYPQSYVPYTGDDKEDPGNETKCQNCTVHAGFMSSWLNTRPIVLPYVLAALEKYPDYEVTLVGHSLGGAVAALAGLEMRLKGWNPLVTTFGQPMIGNKAFVKFLDEQFQLERSDSKLSPDAEAQRFRRVTHVDDPVPLLPLTEWGYAPHAGEIFITKPELSPIVADIQMCMGDHDLRCIAGSEISAFLLDIYQNPIHIRSRSDPCSSYSGVSGAGQAILRAQKDGPIHCASDDPMAPLQPNNWDWSLIPARYRLWELFYAHRDYFWRIGLCIPGGDPTG
ncbi:hypothetical protein N7495_006088 [Penicillium taxi]|uniref:uncharacterized protein n=1 Tax=Penicillium taxi TaxID=168475 RepID=UPI002545510F|nr:uncharacterized protein N7495_006088 [Penicillium taxi]KAJ5894397.1 hypothetical protein N7495_006088 [Penicillium taxi]